MVKSMASRSGWEMMSGFPSCTCTTKPEQLPDELAPGVPHACSHLYVKKSADRDLFHISLSPATSVGSREGSPVGGEAEKPQGVRVLRGGPVSIVLYPMPPSATNDMPRTAQSGPTFASLADERAADDMGVLLMGGVSRANSPASSKRRIVRGCSGRSSPFRRSRSSSADGRSRKACNPGSVTLKMPSRAFEVDIKLDKVVEDGMAKSPNELDGRTDMFESPEANGYNGTIPSRLPCTFLSCSCFGPMTSTMISNV
ncbi:hypothetical protein M758_10G181900 [Ceratodon purpureus]|nr:hypothetical protein M758_10G181900 [Ceratodon purpureus]